MSLVKKFTKDKSKCEVTFTLPREAAQGGQKVELVGEFNNWNTAEGIALVAKKNEYKTVVKLESGKKYEYRFLVDGQWWTNDATPDAFVSNPFGTVNSVVTIEKPTAKVATKKKATAKAKPAKKVVAKKVTTAKAKPAKKTTAKKATKVTATKDKLTKIEGIGPKIQGLLNAAGIETFTELGKTKVTVLRNILAEAGPRYKMHNPSTWAKQSKLAAKGNWDALKTLQDQLNGGV